MKRMIVTTLAVILLISMISQPCAATIQTSVERIYLDDGSYYETELAVLHSRSIDTCYGQKWRRYYDSNDNLQWTVALSVEFEYDPGVSVECIDATCDVYISNDAWVCELSYATRNGASAIAHAEMARKFLLVTTKTIYVDLTVHCDTYGNLS